METEVIFSSCFQNPCPLKSTVAAYLNFLIFPILRKGGIFQDSAFGSLTSEFLEILKWGWLGPTLEFYQWEQGLVFHFKLILQRSLFYPLSVEEYCLWAFLFSWGEPDFPLHNIYKIPRFTNLEFMKRIQGWLWAPTLLFPLSYKSRNKCVIVCVHFWEYAFLKSW